MRTPNQVRASMRSNAADAQPSAQDTGQVSIGAHPPAGLDPALTVRRRFVLALNLITIAGLFAAMAVLLSHNGFIALEWAMLAAYAVTLPWVSIGFWNSLIGFLLTWRYADDAANHVTPALARISGDEAITSRIAIVMPLRNEDPVASLQRFARIQRALSKTEWGAHFDYHVLSDSDIDDIAAREVAAVARWCSQAPGAAISYRRREDNSGYKAGNIAEFLNRCGDDYTYFIPLDADSEMSADAILRMVRVIEASPEIGILQSLVTGLPSKTFFTRAFQFGMRHGMRSYTLGASWWQADCGPNWGHNAIIRTAPFKEHCMMPVLPGRGPLSGHILSHDQLEAVQIRRAGYEVRVIAEETESHEENPPSLADFIRRELRWCNGNMQYLKLLRMPGLAPVSRFQLYLAIQMYLASPAWILFILLGMAMTVYPDQFEGMPVWSGLGLFALVMFMNLMPKLMGLGQILSDSDQSESYGGRARVVLGGAAEILFSILVSPVVAFALSVFMVGLAFGKRVGWDAQQRSRAYLAWSEAARVLWPQTIVGVLLTLWLYTSMPGALWIAAPMLLSFTLAIPIAVVSTLKTVSNWSMTNGLFDIPEDRRLEFSTPEEQLQIDAI